MTVRSGLPLLQPQHYGSVVAWSWLTFVRRQAKPQTKRAELRGKSEVDIAKLAPQNALVRRERRIQLDPDLGPALLSIVNCEFAGKQIGL
jgi:hypothetical protein